MTWVEKSTMGVSTTGSGAIATAASWFEATDVAKKVVRLLIMRNTTFDF